VLAVNLMGVVHTSRAALTYMKSQRFGRIVSVASAAAVVGGYACSAAYAASKAAVACFMKCAAREGAPFGITANSVAPGQIDTAMTAVVLQRVPLASIVERTPLGRLGDPDEVAAAIVFLSSDDASFITGQTVGVNGGMLMV
jgi:3-oxoacyl-[acyl-carrier protein] reductase